MNLVVAIRAQTSTLARQALAPLRGELVKSRLEAQDPALRNLVDGLCARGLASELAGASLHWFLVDTEASVQAWRDQPSVAVCFSAEWLRQQALRIRYLKGIAYCDAAAAWAVYIPFEGQAATAVQAGEGVDWAGQPLQETVLHSAPELPLCEAQEPPKKRKAPAKVRRQPALATLPTPGPQQQSAVLPCFEEAPRAQQISAVVASKPRAASKRGRARPAVDEEQLDLFV